jgi:hypothetical protein
MVLQFTIALLVGTLLADWVCYIFGRSGKGLFHFPRAVHIAETCLLIVSLLLIDVYCGWLLTALFIRK